MRRSITALLALSAIAAALVASVPASAATEAETATPATRPTAVVALGDSYISGEAGRWEGNHARDYGDRRGTDRAAYRRGWFWRYAPNRIYGSTNASGCHRSDVSPVDSSGIAADALVNLACSGASTVNLVRSSEGGVGLKGEPSQADQLAELAATHDVELVVVSVGGNDLGFGAIILDCALDYALSNSWWSQTCNADQQRNVDARLPDAMAGVGRAIDEVRAVLADAGQAPDSFRIALLSYPSPVPSGDEFRYRQGTWSRTFTGGCPFWNVDATWARDGFVPMLADSLAAVAADRGVEFLDLQDALEGREICADGASQGDGADAEWARYLSTGVLQGEAQESLHPNALGQQAIGRCLGLLAAADPGAYRCGNTPGAGPEAMVLSSR